MRRFLIFLLASLLMSGCKLPPIATAYGTITAQAAGSPVRLDGRIQEGPQVQAQLTDVGNGATVALLDPQSGATLATTVASPTGAFSLVFGKTFTLTPDRVYYLQAMKGVKGGNAEFNQPGADQIRIRNVVIYKPEGWISLLNDTPSNTVDLSRRSTALSIILALKEQAGEHPSYPVYMGALENDPFVAVGGISQAGFDQAYTLTCDAIAQDRDPIHFTAYDTNTGAVLNAFIGFSLASVAPTVGNIGTSITITGTGFTADAGVAVNGTPASITSIASGSIVAMVAPGSRTGPVTITIGTTLQAGPVFQVRFTDGHRSVLGDKLYVVNPTWNTLCEVNSSREVRTLVDFGTGAAPQQVIVGPDNLLYVSLKGSNQIRRVDPANPGAHTLFASLTAAYALAFDPNGKLYATSHQGGTAGTVTRFAANGLSVEQTYTGFNLPCAIAFDFAGNFFVSETNGLFKLAPNTPDKVSATLMAAVPAPRGVAVDSAGDAYVASNSSNLIYRVTPARAVFSHLQTNSPSGLCFDDAGNLYVSDSANNLISRVTSLGDSLTYAYGISSPRGLAVDPDDGTLYVALNKSNAVLKVEGGVLKPFVTGIANPETLKFRGNGMFIAHPSTHTVSYVRRSGQMRTVANGLNYPGGVDQAADGLGEPTGPLYAGRFGEQEDPSAALPPSIGGWGLPTGDYMGLDVVNGATVTRRRFLHEQSTDFLTMDATGTVFAVRPGIRTLTRYAYTVPGSGTNTSRQIRQLCGPIAPYQFEAAPGYVALDAAGNVYVSVPAAGKILRFKAAADYAKQEITGFNSPWGITFSDTGAMFVSDPGAGLLRRVTTPATAGTADAWTAPLPASARGIAYYKSATPGTGTLFIANGTEIDQVAIASDAVSGGIQVYFSDLPNPISSLFCDTGRNLYAYANSTYAYKVAKMDPDPPLLSNYIDQTGWSRLRGIGFGPTFALTIANSYYNFISAVNATVTSRELELDGSTLYVASPDNQQGGGVLKIDLATNLETMVTGCGRTYSLALNAANHDLYVGAADGKVYKVVGDGTHTATWTLGTAVYGLDIRETTVWGIGADSVVYEMPIGSAFVARRYGLMGPSF